MEGCYCNSCSCSSLDECMFFHGYVDCIKNPALNEWGYFDSETFAFTESNYQFFIRTVGGQYVKIWFQDYQSGLITIVYQILE